MRFGRTAVRVFTKGRSLEDLQRLRARAAQPPPFGRNPPNERVLSASEIVNRDIERDAIQREAANAVPPGMVRHPMRRPYFQNVYRTTGPRAYVNRDLQDRYEQRLRREERANRRNRHRNGAGNGNGREANVIERQPNPQGADSDVGF